VPEEKLLLNLLNVDLARFSSSPEARHSCRHSLGLHEQQVAFLALGRSPVIKGTDLFVKAAAYTERTTTADSLFLVSGTPETTARRRLYPVLPNRLQCQQRCGYWIPLMTSQAC
jgi:hypothetical protein